MLYVDVCINKNFSSRIDQSQIGWNKYLLSVLTLLYFLPAALVRPVKAWKVWHELAPELHFLSPSPSCGVPGGQVR